MYTISRTSAFDRAVRKFLRRHPDLQQRLASIINDLEADPFQPALRLHPLRGAMEGSFAVSLNFHYRLVLTVDADQRDIMLLDIGNHDEVYR
jgi:mRNA-degrading endonuclease YafQ of YafQ-DinJ toxin-antitoxin module